MNKGFFGWSNAPLVLTPPIENCAMWVSADNVYKSNGETVSKLVDKFGGTTALYQTGSNLPTFVSSGLNGLPSLKFEKASSQYLFSGFRTKKRDTSYYAVVKITSTSMAGGFFSEGGDVNAGSTLGVGSTSIDGVGNNIVALYGAIRHIGTGVALGVGWRLVELHIDSAGTTPEIFINGKSIGTFGGSANSIGGAQVTLGGNPDGSRYFDGEISEFLIYDTVSKAQQTLVRYFIKNKYGIF